MLNLHLKKRGAKEATSVCKRAQLNELVVHEDRNRAASVLVCGTLDRCCVSLLRKFSTGNE